MATLNYPAWGYGLRYKYGLFKQRITKDGQEEVAEDWLEVAFCSLSFASDDSFKYAYWLIMFSPCRWVIPGKL